MSHAFAMPAYVAGVMTGTSMDAIDIALIEIAEVTTLGHVQETVVQKGFVSRPLDPALVSAMAELQRSGEDELHRASLISNVLADAISRTMLELMTSLGLKSSAIAAIGVHGQTIRHQPELGYTIQLNSAARIAEATGITVVSDFRSRDIAAGGQGAPLVPLFHQAIFGAPDALNAAPNNAIDSEHHGVTAVINIGGIANLSWLGRPLLGFDTGPGNTLMDYWIARHLQQPFDRDGAWAASGVVHAPLLKALLSDPFFAKPAPKSTGRDLFHAAWLDHFLNRPEFSRISPQDVQATLLELTAESIANELARLQGQVVQHASCKKVLICGGGAQNPVLMGRLKAAITAVRGPDITVDSTQSHGWHPQWIEAAAFAWLAARTLRGLAGSAPSVTGALGPRILGSITPGL
jgi:anhydro-N-acetylmuramic acid kinase